MSNEVTKQQDQSIVGFDHDEVRVIRALIDPSNKLDMTQIQLFLHVCKERKLDPRLKQIYAIPRKNQNTGRVELTIQTSIDGLRLIAERTNRYAPGRPTHFFYDEKGNLQGAISYVKKQTLDGTWHEIAATAYLCEYMPSSGMGLWGKMPHVMIEKCAESRALRRAFPSEMSGLLTDEEMEQANNKIVEVQEDQKISPDQFIELSNMLERLPDLKKNILNLIKLENSGDSIQDLPKKYFKSTLDRCKKEIENMINTEEQETA
jgi:phage recombination protein Bet